MNMQYREIALINERLKVAHSPYIATIRTKFFKAERDFFQQHIQNSSVLIAGSGRGDDSLWLAKHNRLVIGIEIFPQLISAAMERKRNKEVSNITFVQGDFFDIPFQNNSFDAAVLNMGTISDFEAPERIKLILELCRVTNKVFMDFYPSTLEILKIRRRMYEEEGFLNVQIKDTTIVSSDGLYSCSISEKEFAALAKHVGINVQFYPFSRIAIMAEIAKKEERQ